MAITKITEDWSMRYTERNGIATRTAVRGYDVTFDGTDDPAIEPCLAEVAKTKDLSIPSFGKPHIYWPNLYVTNIRPQCTAPHHYKVTVTWGVPGTSSRNPPGVNPTQLPPKRNWTFASLSKKVDLAYKDTEDGDSTTENETPTKPIANSATESYDPANMKEVRVLVRRIVKNQESYDKAQALEYIDSVNNSTFLGAPAGQVKLAVYDDDELWWNDIMYHQVTYEFHILTLPWGWKLRLVDEGFRELTGYEEDGTPLLTVIKETLTEEEIAQGLIPQPVSEPVLLKNGRIKKESEATQFLTFRLDKKKDFSVFNSLIA